jgi:hypothetical protein
MSAYKKIQCDIVDKETLLEALKILGFDPSVHEFPMHLTGYLGDQRNEMAEIIIPKKQVNFFTGASNDIGFYWDKNEEKFDFICSEYDKKFKMDQRIIQAYAKVAIEKALAKNGFKIKVNIEDEEFRKRALNDLNIVARKII